MPLSISGLSILMALALGLGEWLFFFGWNGEEPAQWFATNRLGFDLAWIIFVYLAFQLVSIPFALRASRERFIGVVDGLASLVPLGVTLVALLESPNISGRPNGGKRRFYCYLSPRLIYLVAMRSISH
jgi:hypothetical protein